jgi:type I restriction enzyme S subunit
MEGDVILAMDRPWIEAGLKYAAVRKSDLPALLVQRVARLRGRRGLDTRFLKYIIGSPAFTAHVLAVQTGTAVPHISGPQIKSFEFQLPPIDEQRTIAHILGTLDDKIELNRRMNETLEAIARAIFKSWFVDFAPARAKAGGRDPGLPQRVADLFPASFEDSELGKIPKGWRIGRLGDLLSALETGGRPKGGVRDYTKGVPSVGAESIVGIGRFDYSKTKFVPPEFFQSMSKGHVTDCDVLLYKDGGRPGVYEPHVTIVGGRFPFAQFCINEHVYRVRTDPFLPQSYLYFWLTSDSAMDEMRTRGTGVAIPGLNSAAVRALAVLQPSPQVLDTFHNIGSRIVRGIFARCSESRTLAALRDALLPKLISGELRVKDAERFIRDEQR